MKNRLLINFKPTRTHLSTANIEPSNSANHLSTLGHHHTVTKTVALAIPPSGPTNHIHTSPPQPKPIKPTS